jgi:hypothetical protein
MRVSDTSPAPPPPGDRNDRPRAGEPDRREDGRFEGERAAFARLMSRGARGQGTIPGPEEPPRADANRTGTGGDEHPGAPAGLSPGTAPDVRWNSVRPIGRDAGHGIVAGGTRGTGERVARPLNPHDAGPADSSAGSAGEGEAQVGIAWDDRGRNRSRPGLADEGTTGSDPGPQGIASPALADSILRSLQGASATGAPDAPTAPVDDVGALGREIAEAIYASGPSAGDRAEVRLALKSREFPGTSVRLVNEGGALRVSLITESPDVHRFLTDRITALGERLGDRFRDRKVTVDLTLVAGGRGARSSAPGGTGRVRPRRPAGEVGEGLGGGSDET